MTRDHILQQLKLIASLLDGAEATEALKPDLTIAACKLKWISTKVVPRVLADDHFERQNIMAEISALRERWARLYWETEASGQESSAPPVVRKRSLRPAPLTKNEQRFLAEDGLDEVAFRLLTAFGRILDESRMEGRWVLKMPGGTVYDAGLIREHLGKVGSATEGPNGLYQIAEDALLLSAGSGISVERFEHLAEHLLGPLVPELLPLDEPPPALVWRLASRLIEQRCLSLGGVPAHRPGRPAEPGVLAFTEVGFQRAASAFHAWFPYSKQQSGWRAKKEAEEAASSRPRDDDIPF